MNGRARGYRAALLTLLTLSATMLIQPALRAQETNRVGLVVKHGDGSVITRCVEFTESEITGLDVLNRAGLSVVADYSTGSGARICTIDGEGCPASDCWCQCAGAPCVFWVYHHLTNGDWVYGDLGASTHKVHNGDVEGWAWGEGSPQGGVQPPVIPFDQICVPPATNTPVPPTDTLVPPTPVVWFRLDHNPVPAGQCTSVRWDTSGAGEVYLDGQQVAATGDVQACPAEPQEYHLRVVSAGWEQTYTLVLGVEGTPVPSATATSPAPSPTPTPSPTPEASATPTLTRTRRPTATTRPTERKPSATPSETASPSPSATPTIPETTPTATSEPAHTPTATATGAPSPTLQPQPPEDSEPGTTGYAIFGAVAAGLAGLVIFLARRR